MFSIARLSKRSKTARTDRGRRSKDSAFGCAWQRILALETLEQRRMLTGDPVAHAGGPYSVVEGSQIVLDASASSDPDEAASSLVYEWDLDYDGVSFQVDASGWQPVFSARQLDGPTTRTVAVRVTDDGDLTSIATATVEITNGAPTVSIEGTPVWGVKGNDIALTSLVNDPGVDDTFTHAWTVRKDGTFYASGADAEFTFLPTECGRYEIELAVTDDDGDTGRAVAVTQVVVYWDGDTGYPNWEYPQNWSGDAVPGPDDDVIIDSPVDLTVTVSTPDQPQVVRSLHSTQAVTISSGASLNISAASEIATLTLVDGMFNGTGSLTITNHLEWIAGAISGTGDVVIRDGATALLGQYEPWGYPRILDGSRLIIESGATAVWIGEHYAGDLELHHGAVIEN
ncbi:MAG: hypothetical protein MUF48_21430, partial [Pirellulaceae bacterium]|nr:hypothetical protein [Pirellulaceae bacterium]